MYFNEGLAEFVGDALTDVWLVERFSAFSPERAAWTVTQARRRGRVDHSFAYQALDTVYKARAGRSSPPGGSSAPG
jgi:hypothetical protein